MTKIRFLAAALLMGGFAAAATADNGFWLAPLRSRVQPSVVYIETSGWTDDGAPMRTRGTGFVVSTDGWVVIAAHELKYPMSSGSFHSFKKITSIKVRTGSRYSTDVQDVWFDMIDIDPNPKHDIAMFKLRGKPTFAAANICTDHDFHPGEPIAAIGFPNSDRDIDLVPFAGAVAGDNGRGGWSIDRRFVDGMSGAPVALPDGRVVGIAIESSDEIGWFLPLSRIHSFIRDETGREPSSCNAVQPAVGVERPKREMSATVEASLQRTDASLRAAVQLSRGARDENYKALAAAKLGEAARLRAENGMPGYGKIEFRDHNAVIVYLGEVVRWNNALHMRPGGVGERRYPNGNVYQGHVAERGESGSGVLNATNFRRLSGVWKDGTFVYGLIQGDIRVPNTREAGSFKFIGGTYRLDGAGCLYGQQFMGTKADLCGEVVDGHLQGFGQVLFVDGRYWKGQWNKNVLNGVGAKFKPGSPQPVERGFYVDGMHVSD